MNDERPVAERRDRIDEDRQLAPQAVRSRWNRTCFVTTSGTWWNPVIAHRPAIIVSRSRWRSSAATYRRVISRTVTKLRGIGTSDSRLNDLEVDPPAHPLDDAAAALRLHPVDDVRLAAAHLVQEDGAAAPAPPRGRCRSGTRAHRVHGPARSSSPCDGRSYATRSTTRSRAVLLEQRQRDVERVVRRAVVHQDDLVVVADMASRPPLTRRWNSGSVRADGRASRRWTVHGLTSCM